jgi:O-antigen ligase
MNLALKSESINLKNPKLRYYLVVFGLLYLLLVLSLSIAGKFIPVIALLAPIIGIIIITQPVIALLAPIIGIIIITQPKLAVYQFVFLFFTNIAIIDNPVILLVDISALLLISAAFLDYLLKPDAIFKRPKLLINFIIIIIAVSIAAMFGYKPILALRPIAKLLYLTATFLAVHRLSRYFEIKKLLKLFFWFAVLSSLIALWPYLTGGETTRLFGFSRATLDDILLITIPLGLVLMLFSDKKKGKWMLLGILIMSIALVATQSRLSLMLTAGFSIIAIYLVKKHLKINKLLSKDHSSINYLINRRIKKIVISVLFLFTALFMLKPDILIALWERFESLLLLVNRDTLQIRFVLWGAAVTAFLDHPILGIGPGMFKLLPEIYPELRFSSIFIYVQGFSSHNMILHYLAETGLVGGLAASIFLVSSFFEAGWLWGQLSYMFVFFVALVVRANELITD